MKRRWIGIISIILVGLISTSIWSMSPAYYLRSRLTNLTAELYKQMSDMVEPGADGYFSLAILPLMDVNGEAPELTMYLYQNMSGVINQFPGLRVTSNVETVKAWNELRQQKMSDAERFRQLGKRLKVSSLIMTSLVTHATHYTINGMVINATTGYQYEIDQIILERGLIDALPREEILAVAKAAEDSLKQPAPKSGAGQVSTSGNPGQSGATGQSSTGQSGSSGTTNQPGSNQSGKGQTAQPTTPGSSSPSSGQSGSGKTVATEPAKSDTSKAGSTTEPPRTTEPGQTGNPTMPQPEGSSEAGTVPGNSTPATIPVFRHQLIVKEQSPMLSSILLGMDIGDLNGDGTDELVYCAGPSIQVRNLTNYFYLWTYDKYQPTTRDYKILAVDLDGDGKDEVASHGSLLKVVNNKLTTQQPRFVARPVSLYKQSGVAIFDKNSIYIVNFQGLVMRQFLMNATAKRFVFADLEGDGKEEIIALMDGEAENLKAQIYTTLPHEAKQTLSKPLLLEGTYSNAIRALDLNQNGLPEIYLSRNFFSGNQFLYSKIYVFESDSGVLKQVAESPELNYFIVDFAGYPKKNPNRLVVGGMALNNKNQSPAEIKSKIMYFALE